MGGTAREGTDGGVSVVGSGGVAVAGEGSEHWNSAAGSTQKTLGRTRATAARSRVGFFDHGGQVVNL